MSFRRATLWLWASVARVGAFLGYVPAVWRDGRARPLSRGSVLRACGCCQLATVIAICAGRRFEAIFVLRASCMLIEGLLYSRGRRGFAVLVDCLWRYLGVHPLRAARWRALFLATAVTVAAVAAHGSYLVVQFVGAAEGASTVAFIGLRMAVATCMYLRLFVPLAVVTAAAADLRADCARAALQRGLQRGPAWRALRQRQFLLHDMLRKSSDVNGPCVFFMMVFVFLVTRSTIYDDSSTLFYYGVNLLLNVVVIVACQLPAREVLLCTPSP